MTVVVTGYEPFGELDTNPTAHVAAELDGETVAGESVVGAVLPVAFDSVTDRLESLLAKHDPTVFVSTGVARGSAAVRIERVGVNVADAVTTPDNVGADPRNERLADGPAAYFSTLPVESVVTDLLDEGIPACLSNTAGTHLCNDALYTVRHAVERDDRETRSGFVHLPFSPSLAAAAARENEATRGGSVPPSMALTTQTRAVRLAIETTLGSM
ncbi:peptidase [Halogeometricum borinquense]|uniref:Peptidase n=1 Tax=Halogeometricum borinquense TaxID=60847 RepID=A0A482T8A9_9EURY|nr:peptidase [Halogeometricum borinquense]RYJ12882.1 peptidase [Halogeometricum borinquense]